MSNYDDSKYIGIWGPERAGKTTYVLALKQYLRRAKSYSKSQSQDRVITRDSKWEMIATPETQGKLRQAEDRFVRGIFPEPTDPNQAPDYYDFTFKKGDDRYDVTVVDAAGKHILDDADPSGYLGLLGGCSGLLILLDTKSDMSGTEQSYFAALDRLLSFMAPEGRVRQSIAFCLGKVDQDDLWSALHHEGKQINELCWEHVPGFADFYENHQKSLTKAHFFAISAVGRVATPRSYDRPNIVVEGPSSRMVDPDDGWLPFRLFDPLLWLFDQLDSEILNPLERSFKKRHYQE